MHRIACPKKKRKKEFYWSRQFHRSSNTLSWSIDILIYVYIYILSYTVSSPIIESSININIEYGQVYRYPVRETCWWTFVNIDDDRGEYGNKRKIKRENKNVREKKKKKKRKKLLSRDTQWNKTYTRIAGNGFPGSCSNVSWTTVSSQPRHNPINYHSIVRV